MIRTLVVFLAISIAVCLMAWGYDTIRDWWRRRRRERWERKSAASAAQRQRPDGQAAAVNPPGSVPTREGRNIRHIVCICYNAPDINNSIKPQLQNFIVNAEQGRGNVVTPTSRITLDSFFDNGDLERPDMIRQKLQQVYSQFYRQSTMFELADQTVPREVQYKDGHVLVKYYVLYE